MKDLAEKSGVTTGTLTVGVDRLEKKGLLVRKPHEKDRRAYLIELTPEGEKYFKLHHRFHLKMTEELVADLTQAEIAHLSAILEKILLKL